MNKPAFDKPYEPNAVEKRWYSWWEERGFFHADERASSGGNYSIVIPPPNVTGSLHLGHALNNTLQDILIRWRRMCGDLTVWIPGTDHAGIATQNVVERQLRDSGTDRERLGRSAFIERVWKWRQESGGTIIAQLKRLGASCDWKRERFTMDDGLSAAVREVFVRLYEEGLIYRGERLINWCPRCRTALSDIEVEHEERKAKMYHIQYPLADDPSVYLTVATTRPETLLGDTAVAVHPEDSRYNHLIGKKVILPLTDRKIPIVGDSILVDREFGTGAVKITPGHDFNDEKAGKRHDLPVIALIGKDGTMTQLGMNLAQVTGEYGSTLIGESMTTARERVVAWLEESGLLLEVQDHRHSVGTCYRCKTLVEPLPSAQWFVKINDPGNSLAAPAIDAVRSGKIRIIPEGWKNNYFGWMEQIQDWCISRQIWWGHQIPAWYCQNCIANSVTGPLSSDRLESSDNLSLEVGPIVRRERPDECPVCRAKDFIQDPDVLDTWFSSALWPFSTLGWPEKTRELEVFYPTSALVTSFDILFFWVARMIMMGLRFMGEIPFRDVYIHALVRDAEGQKMSKSKGNVIDPLGVMGQYGTDALRFTLASMASPGRDIRLSEDRIAGYRNFANKLWNAARFVHMNLGAGQEAGHPNEDLSLADRWIRVRLDRCVKSVNATLENYRFDEAARVLYQFIWNDYCDWYLELAKSRLAGDSESQAKGTQSTMVSTLETALRLLHPIMPFITEEVWQSLPHSGPSLCVAPFPKGRTVTAEDAFAEATMNEIIGIITGIRSVRSELGIPAKQHLSVSLRPEVPAVGEQIMKYGADDIRRLARVSAIGLASDGDSGRDETIQRVSAGRIQIDLAGVDLGRALSTLEKSLAARKSEMDKIEAKRGNPNFAKNAPQEVVTETEIRRADLNREILDLTRKHEQIKALLSRHAS
jgi:valyl-tRNA synthetase